MGSASKVKRKPAHVGSAAGEKALERETRADGVFSPRQEPAVEAKRPAKKPSKQAVRSSPR
ncbi:MAG: hypothetical protein Q8L14_37145 [Myxococcales bacterium]|nr:hypothetical protein [Myxococcales bacterium]